MDVITAVVIGGMSVPPVVERPEIGVFVVPNREIAVREPHHLQTSAANPVRVESLVVDADQTVGSERWLFVYPTETLAGEQPLSDRLESVEVDWCTVRRIG